jgi:CHAT domain-containing protein
VPEDAVVLVYRVTDREVVTFAVEREGVTAGRAEIDRRAFAQLVEGYGRQMAARADVTASSHRISELTLAPVLERLTGKRRIALVPHGPLRYVAFAALPMAEGEAVIDRLAVLTALGPKSAVVGLVNPFSGLSKAPIVALGAGAPLPGRVDPPLPFAKKELEVIREEYPRAALVSGRQLTKGVFLSSLEGARGVFHFAGHSYLAGEGSGRFVDPLGGRLRTADGSVSMLDVLSSSTHAELVVLSACHTMLGPEGGPGASGDELRSLAQAFRFAGARWIVATSMHVHDLTASMVMKRFYRALRNEDVIFALRDAQRRVRALYPHPAWWATFSILI